MITSPRVDARIHQLVRDPDPCERAAIARKTDSAPPRIVCAWCPDFDPRAQPADVSHGMCPTCAAQLNAELDRLEASR